MGPSAPPLGRPRINSHYETIPGATLDDSNDVLDDEETGGYSNDDIDESSKGLYDNLAGQEQLYEPSPAQGYVMLAPE